MAVYMISLFVLNRGEAEARSLDLHNACLANLGLILANRSWTSTTLAAWRRPNPALKWVVGGALVFLTVVFKRARVEGLVPFHRILHPVDIAICLATGVLSILWFEVFKALSQDAVG
jgi:Ca2+-transporting ATPase